MHWLLYRNSNEVGAEGEAVVRERQMERCASWTLRRSNVLSEVRQELKAGGERGNDVRGQAWRVQDIAYVREDLE